VQASVTLLEQLPVLLDKVTQADLQQEVLPMLYMALESNMSQVQVRAICMTQVQVRVTLQRLR